VGPAGFEPALVRIRSPVVCPVDRWARDGDRWVRNDEAPGRFSPAGGLWGVSVEPYFSWSTPGLVPGFVAWVFPMRTTASRRSLTGRMATCSRWVMQQDTESDLSFMSVVRGVMVVNIAIEDSLKGAGGGGFEPPRALRPTPGFEPGALPLRLSTHMNMAEGWGIEPHKALRPTSG
jgi:hypothetical protein